MKKNRIQDFRKNLDPQRFGECSPRRYGNFYTSEQLFKRRGPTSAKNSYGTKITFTRRPLFANAPNTDSLKYRLYRHLQRPTRVKKVFQKKFEKKPLPTFLGLPKGTFTKSLGVTCLVRNLDVRTNNIFQCYHLLVKAPSESGGHTRHYPLHIPRLQ